MLGRRPSMLVLVGALLALLVALSVLGVEVNDGGSSQTATNDSVTITQWQFCFGCKQSVALYTKRASEEISRMQRSKVKSSSVLEANGLVEKICDHPDILYRFQPFVRYSCIKLFTDHQNAFLSAFAGKASLLSMESRAEMFERKRKICEVETMACKPSDFAKADVPSASRTRCAACKIVAEEMYTMSHSLLVNVSMPKLLQDEHFCASLATNLQPYAWVEDVCDEMVEDHASDIMETIRFYLQVVATGLTPNESVTEMICREQYKCPSAAKKDDL